MKVTLITYTSDAERIISAAAQLCYSPSSINEIVDGITNGGAEKFVRMLSDLGHESPIEHVSFTFGIEGVSRSLMSQITRHRIASFSIQSQRYVPEKIFEYVTPPSIEHDPQTKKKFDDIMKNIHDSYIELSEILREKNYQDMIQWGKEETKAKIKAEKQAIEDARYVLPNACNTKMIVTMNARSLKHFFELRCCNRAQWEIRDLANRMLKLVYQVAPTLFYNAGPACLKGKCSEGKMSCGKAIEVKEYYNRNIFNED